MNLRRHFNVKKQQKMAKTAKNGLKLLSLIASKILELEKSLLNKIFCPNIKLKVLFYKFFSNFSLELAMLYIFASWRLGISSCAKIPAYLIIHCIFLSLNFKDISELEK